MPIPNAPAAKAPQENRSEPGRQRPAEPQFQAIRSTRAFEEIATQIRSQLLQGRLMVGSRLPPERSLAAQFGVSRSTLREALRSLENAGLIQLQKGATGGAFIAERSGAAIVTGLFDLYYVGAIQPPQVADARVWLGSIIVREACRRATAEDLAALEQNVAEAEAASLRGDFLGRVARHTEFERMLVRLTGNPIIVIVANGLLDVLQHFAGTARDHQNDFVSASRRRLIQHLRTRNVEAAVAEMEECSRRLHKVYFADASATESTDTQEPSQAPPPPKPSSSPRRAAAARVPASRKKAI